jgi:glycosyltransferase involved in cell wall biosynthesis/SAM-dependent methyltransferase
MHTVTIAARNYLSRARALAKSYRATNPDHRMTILLVDAEPGEIPSTDEYRVATPADLPISVDEVRKMAMIYNITEFNTALKPWALEMLLNEGADVATYLDPDILVYESMDEVARLAREFGIVLTPHADVPIPRDGLRPTEADIMGSGIYNLGFISVGPQAVDMLHWWQDHLRRDSIVAPQQMVFVDQRWIDLVPGYFGHTILRDPGYNVAYWNLDNRKLTRVDDKILVNGQPLRFFHFSGYSHDQPWILSKYVSDKPRVVLSEHPIVQELCDGYGAIIGASTNDQSTKTPYRFGTFSDGTRLTEVARLIYRNALTEVEKNDGDPLPTPFTDDDVELLAWFRAPVRPGVRMNRFLHGMWSMRPDLSEAFPEPLAANEDELINWAWHSLDNEPDLIEALLPPQQRIETEPIVSSDEPGVNLAGYFHAEMGVGETSRLLADAVRATGLPFSTIVDRTSVSRQNAHFEAAEDSTRYPVNIAAVNADQFPIWAREVGSELLRGRYTIGLWAWETEEFPFMAGALHLVDEIWAVSRFVQRGVAATTDKPVLVAPLPVPVPEPHDPLDRSALGIPDGPYFLFVFDHLSVFERKNPMGLVEAFTRAFADGTGPTLVIKSINGSRFRSERERLRRACGERHDIVLIEDYLDAPDLDSLMGEASAYVSLHRAEGFGLTIADAMARGVPAVATGYSGNLDFMNAQNSLLVPYQRINVGKDAFPYRPDFHWAEPDLDAAADYLRWLHSDPDGAAELGQRGRDSLLANRSVEATATFIRQRVEAGIESLHARELVAGPGGPPASALDRARNLIDTVPDVHSPSRLPRAASLVRRGIYRGLAHHDEHVNVRLNALADAVAEAEAEVQQQTATSESIRALSSQVDAIVEELSLRGTLTEVRVGQLNALRGRVQEAHEGLQAVSESQDKLGTHLHGIESHIETLTTDISGRLDRLTDQANRMELEQTARPYMSRPEALTITDPDGRPALGYDAASLDETASYAGFEDIFRGSEDFISGRLKPYLPVLAEQAPVFDLGCGRGELLELLRGEGIEARGIDLDASMVERCAAHGLDVTYGDGVAALGEMTAESLGAVTSIQVVEHVPVDLLRPMFTAALSALRPGGVFIAETVNPHSPGALKTFWLDLTHIRPLYPESLLLLAREVGFASARIMFPVGSGDLDADLRTCGEYALVATKA